MTTALAERSTHAAGRRARRRCQWSWLPCVLLWLAAALFRLPPLLNARGVDSDAAVVGLQARHLLHGEWAWFLWGAGYQGIGDVLLTALGFAVTGSRPLTLMAIPLLGHLLLIGFVWAVVRRRLGVALATLAALPLVFAPAAVNGVALYPPRQWAITLIFAAFWLFDGASAARRPRLRYAAGALLGTLALYLDLFALQFLPGLVAFALACSLDGDPPARARWRRIGVCGLGFAAGLGLLWLVRQQPGASFPTEATPLAGYQRLRLLLGAALPWVLSAKVFIPGTALGTIAWRPPAPIVVVQYAGAALFLAGLAYGAIAAYRRTLPWPVRRLGGLGGIVAATSLTGFVVSTSPQDVWSARYLAPLIWIAPFAFAPAASLLQPRRFALALAPYLVAAAVGGWLSYGPYVAGAWPVRSPRGVATEEAQLGAALRERGVGYAAAQYWLAYRLTFLWDEQPIVVPLDPAQDRYAPYRQGFAAATTVALIFHPSEPRATPDCHETQLRQAGATYERLTIAGFTVLLWHRGPPERGAGNAERGMKVC